MGRKKLHSAVKAIRDKASELAWPVRFATDLDHDERAIERRSGLGAFGWAIHDSGTFLAFAILNGERYSDDHRYFRMVDDTFRNPAMRWFLWNGQMLIEERSASDLDARLREIAESLNAPSSEIAS